MLFRSMRDMVGNIRNLSDLDLQATFNTELEVAPEVEVVVDIKPGGFPNSWGCRSVHDPLPVAILSTNGLDATTVDANTVRFGKAGTEAAEVHRQSNGDARRHVSDVNNDGWMDLLLHFRSGSTGFSCADIPAGQKSATLPSKVSGATVDGRAIAGEDTLRLLRQ